MGQMPVSSSSWPEDPEVKGTGRGRGGSSDLKLSKSFVEVETELEVVEAEDAAEVDVVGPSITTQKGRHNGSAVPWPEPLLTEAEVIGTGTCSASM